MGKKLIDWKVLAVGLIVLGAVEITALCNGRDGTMLTAVIGIIGFTLGLTLPTPRIK